MVHTAPGAHAGGGTDPGPGAGFPASVLLPQPLSPASHLICGAEPCLWGCIVCSGCLTDTHTHLLSRGWPASQDGCCLGSTKLHEVGRRPGVFGPRIPRLTQLSVTGSWASAGTCGQSMCPCVCVSGGGGAAGGGGRSEGRSGAVSKFR